MIMGTMETMRQRYVADAGSVCSNAQGRAIAIKAHTMKQQMRKDREGTTGRKNRIEQI